MEDPLTHALNWLRQVAGLAFLAVVAALAVVRLLRHQIASLVGFVLVAGVTAVLVFAPGVVRDVFVTLVHVVTGR